MIRKTLPVLIGTLLSSTLAFADVSLEIKGLDGALEDNVDAYLSAIPEEEYSISLRFQSRLESMIKEALNALGYYQPVIIFTHSEDDTELTVNVDPGEPVLIYESDIVLSGEAKDDPDFLALIAKSSLSKGSILNHGNYDSLKSSIRNLGLSKGYFDGSYEVSKLEVAPELNRAYVRLHYNSGIRYHFGTTQVTGSQIEDDRVQSLKPFEDGEPYSITKVGEYNQNLSNTDWFSSVFVEPDLSQLGEGREIPMKVSLAPQARNQIETGIGVSTDLGVKGTLKWKKPWVNAQGHSFNSSLSISKPEQTITAAYKIPLDDVLNDYYQIKYGMKNLDNRDTKSLESNLALERYWRLDNGWQRTVFIRYLVENYEQGLQDDLAQFVLPGISFSRTRTRGGSMPMWGDKQTIMLEAGDDTLLSETKVVRFQGQTAWIRSIGNNHRGLTRLQFGGNFADEFEKLSPSLRFFAGGDNSIRGYGYESISPRDESDALTGAKFLATSSFEYQYRLVGNWWGAAFYDIGDAFNDKPDWKRGTGVGVRWASPVGPVSLDFAWGLDAKKGDEFQLHFSLGPEL
ncbi:translocation and assembly module subunit TamA [Vibrio crassostreae]|uniref:autotransporter assembly complex protein TamA n=1 Tax=Vibrio crassostreae TaxID=246167 RepID=UPI00104F1020|nr:autotransporter assembly complex family protein [Vibrio crassostreae]TCN80930.1 autotransporter secretion outer membrane protein TamA [Vibrio crassostreae]CAK2493477.1 translocation and assembly module subunit TamA [Vibrio crassostreae]CAK2495222.1 translocation and assembly module subunit TamA [Vibrio crassostreae]CAK3821436.1 translocation and assembly module subunit TamA [Vibrio crassostreae]CAK3953161.1 translocation and assembly module subunit TamA [Vibrio crassostreae]